MNSPGSAVARLCRQKGIQHVVISPGSRSGPLTVGFARCEGITVHISLDERSAGYLALGIAQQSKTVVTLVCTSGTASLNYSPAIAEAYYQHVPLLVITADRPPEWIDQQDGQAIHQPDVYAQHCKKCFNLPVDTSHKDGRWHFFRSVSEAVNLAEEGPKGPVQINIPIREPFYDALLQEGLPVLPPGRTIETVAADLVLAPQIRERLRKDVGSAQRILLLAGQARYSEHLRILLQQLAAVDRVVVGDILANLHGVEGIIHITDGLLDTPDLGPATAIDLLISFGQSVLSKKLKNFLRSCQIEQHWHIQPYGEAADTFQKLTRVIRLEPADFIENILGHPRGQEDRDKDDRKFIQTWQLLGKKSAQVVHDFFRNSQVELSSGEFRAVFSAIKALPRDTVLHLGNSMTVRYASLAGIGKEVAEVFSNRGTSGIDGCLSTALGHALADPKRPHWLLIGDIAFFYDRNALWRTSWPEEKLPVNLTIIVLNNHGGGIFNMLPGARDLPEAEKYFVCAHSQNAKNTAEDSGLEYICCSSDVSPEFFTQLAARIPNKPRLVEILKRVTALRLPLFGQARLAAIAPLCGGS